MPFSSRRRFSLQLTIQSFGRTRPSRGFRFLPYKEWQVESFGHIHSFHGCATPLWGDDHPSHLIQTRVKILWLPRTTIENSVLRRWTIFWTEDEWQTAAEGQRVPQSLPRRQSQRLNRWMFFTLLFFFYYEPVLISALHIWLIYIFLNSTKSVVIYLWRRDSASTHKSWDIDVLWHLVLHMLLYLPLHFLTRPLRILSYTKFYWKSDGGKSGTKKEEKRGKKKQRNDVCKGQFRLQTQESLFGTTIETTTTDQSRGKSIEIVD